MSPSPSLSLADLISHVPHLALLHSAQANNPRVHAITLDSRRVKPGTVFVAAKGVTARSHDGHAFIQQALQQGAVALVVQDTTAIQKPVGVPVFLTANARACAAVLVEKLWGNPSSQLSLTGVTGTNGKTTVTFLVQAILQAAGQRASVLGTLGAGVPTALTTSSFTTPEAEDISPLMAALIQQDFDAVCMEVSSHALATHRVDGLQFEAAGFTNLSVDHLDFHNTLDAYQEAKDRLFLELLPKRAPCILPFGHHLIGKLQKSRVMTWGLIPEALIHADNVWCNATSTRMHLTIDGISRDVECPLVGEFNVENILCAAGLAYATGASMDAIAQGLSEAKGPPGRLQRVPLPKGPHVFVDYAHTPDALERVLTTLRVMTPGNLIVVFGCGGDRDATKRSMMGEVASRLADMLIVTDDNPRSESPSAIRQAILGGIPSGTHALEIGDRAEAIEKAILSAQANDVVLIAGKGHEQTQTIGNSIRPFSDLAEARRAGENWT